MARFSERNNFRRARPRTLEAAAPERIRQELRSILVERHGEVNAYQELCQALYLTADEVWSADWACPRLDAVLKEMEWYEVYDLLEREYEAVDLMVADEFQDRVNTAFAEAGVVYEFREGYVERLDQPGELLGIQHNEESALDLLKGRFRPVHEQYRKALSALHGHPADYKAAVREALNAVEAVSQIITGKTKGSLGDCMNVLFGPTASDYEKAFASSLKSLYGYASQVPGARHGQHTDVTLSFDESLLAVRVSGAAIAFLIAAAENR